MCWNFVRNVYKLLVLLYCCSLLRGRIAFGPTGPTAVFDISSGGEAT